MKGGLKKPALKKKVRKHKSDKKKKPPTVRRSLDFQKTRLLSDLLTK